MTGMIAEMKRNLNLRKGGELMEYCDGLDMEKDVKDNM